MSDLDRAIAIIEESRQTHVNWAEWRRKGNGTDTDHEMIGDLEWHEAAIRDYDHVLAVLLASQERTQPDRHENGFAKCDTCDHLRGEHHNRRPWEANREDARLRCYHSNGGMVADCACREFVVIDHEGWCNLDPAHAGRCRRSLSTDTPEEPSDG